MRHLNNARGLTLIEILIVLMIIAATATIGVSRFDRDKNEIKSTLRNLSVLSKELHTKARIKNLTYRLVIQMDDEKGHGFWVESASSTVLITEEMNSGLVPGEKKEQKSDEEGATPPPFSPDAGILKEPISLPGGLKFEDVEVTGIDKKISGGLAYIYFVPQGLVQESAIHITNGDDLQWTMAIHPLTGSTRFLQEYVALKDIRQSK